MTRNKQWRRGCSYEKRIIISVLSNQDSSNFVLVSNLKQFAFLFAFHSFNQMYNLISLLMNKEQYLLRIISHRIKLSRNVTIDNVENKDTYYQTRQSRLEMHLIVGFVQTKPTLKAEQMLNISNIKTKQSLEHVISQTQQRKGHLTLLYFGGGHKTNKNILTDSILLHFYYFTIRYLNNWQFGLQISLSKHIKLSINVSQILISL